jgi:hypothetical protein
MADVVCDAVRMRRDGDPEPIQIVPADQSVFRGAQPVPSRAPAAPRARRPRWQVVVAGAAAVALVLAVGERNKRSAAPAPESSAAFSTLFADASHRPVQIGPYAPLEAAVSFRLVLSPRVARVHDVITVSIDGVTVGLGPVPMVLNIDDRTGEFWRSLAWFVGAPPGGGPFVSGAVLGDTAGPPPDMSVPQGDAADPFQVQVEGLAPGDYRVCRNFPRLGYKDDYYVCTVLTVVQ